jgi:hypothetical protein
MTMKKTRKDHEPPLAIQEWGWRYHHLGIPTSKQVEGEVYLAKYKFFVAGFSASPFGVEWMRFEPGCTLHELIKTIPHIAFEVDDLDQELAKHNFKIIGLPGSPSEGVRSAMIEYNGAPVELIEFR